MATKRKRSAAPRGDAATKAKAKADRSEAQRAASRANGARSRGPGPENRHKVKLNGLVHGLRSEHVTLPGEDPADFEAIRRALHDEWHPVTLTRALLVDRLALHVWRLRRATRADIAYRAVTADGTAFAFDNDRRRRVDGALARIYEEPTAALADLESHAYGIDRLLTTWSELDTALGRGPSAWDRPFYHDRLMLVHGRHASVDAALIGPAGRASARLLAANTPGGAALPAEEADAAVEDIRRVVAENLERLRALRAQATDPEEQRRQMTAAAMVDETHGAQLRIRYEMALERSMRSTIKQLMELERTGADLNEPDETDPPAARPGPAREGEAPAEPSRAAADRSGGPGTRPEAPVRASSPGVSKRDPSHPATSSPQIPAAEAVAPAPGSVGAGASRPGRRRPDPAKRVREDRKRAAKRPGKRGSTS